LNALFDVDDLHIIYYIAETLTIVYVVNLCLALSYKMKSSLDVTDVVDDKVDGHDKF
jgi:hypothetical protein